MIKRVAYLTVISLLLISIGVWSPWEKYDITFATLFGVKRIEKLSGLEMYSLKDELELSIDGKYSGSVTPEGGQLLINQLDPGIHIINLKHKSNNAGAYFELSKSINFLEGVNVVLAYELGPSRTYSQGHVFYARKSSALTEVGNVANLNILTQTDPVAISLDGKSIGNSPIRDFKLNLDKVYTLKFQKAGYEDLEFNILPEKQEERDKLKNLDLFIETDMFLIPLQINKETT